MELTASQTKKIQDYFAKQKDIVAVYLYGSARKGVTNKRSDIDFGILFDDGVDVYHRLGEIYSQLPDLQLEPDVRDLNLDYSPVYLLNVIQGELIYERDERKRVNFEVTVMKQFYDTEHLRNTNLEYMRQRLKDGSYGY